MNIVIPVIDKNKEKFNSLLSELMEDENMSVFVGIEEKNKPQLAEFEEASNIKLISFTNGSSTEQIINSLQNHIGSGATVVIRKPISIKELYNFVNCNCDVATCKVERSKIKGFFFNLWQVFLKFFLGVREYEGDTSVVFINEDINAVVGESGNLSFATRANRWRGIQQTTIEVKGEPVKKDVDKKTVVKFSLIASFSLLLAIIVTTVLCLTVKIGIIAGLLIVCLDVICLAISIMTTIIIIFNCRVGKKQVKEVV